MRPRAPSAVMLMHRPIRRHVMMAGTALGALCTAQSAHASLFSGDTLDLVANILAWIVLFVAPAIAIAVFWIVHILPERIAEKRHHPQAPAIKTLCLLSLFFGGMLWPFAWLWAYSKPVFYKLAYGQDALAPPHAENPPPATVVEESVESTSVDDTGAAVTTERGETRRAS